MVIINQKGAFDFILLPFFKQILRQFLSFGRAHAVQIFCSLHSRNQKSL